MTSHDKFTIKTTLTEADVNGRDYITLDNEEEVGEHIVTHWHPMNIHKAISNKDGVELTIRDIDTKSDHKVNFRCNASYAGILQGHWRLNFIERRSLKAGDEIGFFWDPVLSMLCFSVLMKNYL
ncbi:hypothetical protein Ddye_005324 [Dipteronia dyeriana]|uniref:TF-B3 domain-containing protein n=1 Tax=Dipteronia dyeriana TaxID=168575 RepID=A0AAD9XGL2_9ROSI|nr:hypothetical protein Ddye_005324 [Dipteronia dyeriana]